MAVAAHARGRGSSRRVAGFDRLGAAEGQRRLAAFSLAGDGLEQEATLVAELQLLEHTAGKPVPELGQDRRATRPLAPADALELVDLVAVSPPNNSARSSASSGTKWTTRTSAR